ncbi:MAG TPA: hypothetical protein VFB38_25205 [Chthonomonadaceae bacterium]|nr:hypothetical protein [Chthonomonadaceae bacterium]
MPDEETQQPFWPRPADTAADAEALRPLRRLRQLAAEIQAALEHGDLEIVCQAAALLAPTLARCQQTQARLNLGAGEAAELALQTRAALDACEATLRQALRDVAAEMRRLRQGRRTIALVRARRPAATGYRLDTQR